MSAATFSFTMRNVSLGGTRAAAEDEFS